MNDITQAPETVAVTVNGVEIAAAPGELLIDACERTGTFIPRFCYHPRLEPVGMCRMCLVDVDTGRGPALLASCMISVSPGMKVDTESERTRKAQDGVLEFLLVNHPLDCPVCDKGGECPLQDQTVAFGPGESRFVEEKRHFEKPIPINDNVYLDRERCILCDRCTRFAADVAGDALIHFQGRGSNTEVNTFPDEPFSSYFSGNVVQICPVGALTAKPYRFKARPWDLDETESTATIDSVGSRITTQASRNRVLRHVGVDSDAVNWGWLTDKDRFSFEALDSEGRLTGPLRRDGDALVATTWPQALRAAGAALKGADPARVGVIGGARLTNEAQYLWAKLAKGVIGTDNVDAQVGDGLPAEFVLSLPRATVADACTPKGTIVLVGCDPKEELGALYLRLRHAVVNDDARLIEITPRSTGLSRHAAHSLHPVPGEIADLVRALLADDPDETAGVAADQIAAAGRSLRAGTGPVTVILGRGSTAEVAGPTVDAAIALRDALPGVRFLPALRRGNVHGALDMGLAPGLLPGRATLTDGEAAVGAVWPGVPATRGLDTHAMLAAAADGKIDTLVLLGADPLTDFPDRDLARRALAEVSAIIAVDLFRTASVDAAHVVLAAAGPGEVDGSFTNLEGRISGLGHKVTPPGTARADWVLATEVAHAVGADLGVTSLDEVWTEVVRAAPTHAGVSRSAIAAAGAEGILVPGVLTGSPDPGPTPTAPRDAYGLRLVATRSMFDQGTVIQQSPALAGLATDTAARMNAHELDKLGLSAGDQVTVTTSRGVLTLAAIPDAGVPRGVVAITINQANAKVGDLVDAASVATDVRLERA